MPVTPAILNAVSRAIGVRINKVPASPEVVLEAIRTGKCDVPTMEQQVKRAGKMIKARALPCRERSQSVEKVLFATAYL